MVNDDFTDNQSSKDLKKAQKDAKKAEKLAKLQMKQQAMVNQPKAAKPKEIKQASGGYDPSAVESFWTGCWKRKEWFKPRAPRPSMRSDSKDKRFSMCIPPPNITGSLHIGHAMMISIEDAIVRYKRITGHEVLYLPGLDHAGIATQNVVLKSVGNVSRDEFMDAAHKWSAKYGSRIYEQFDRMGCSVDYSRKVFTLDKQVSQSVNQAFVALYNKGLIYRDSKIVNWSGKLKTTISDLEVNYKDVKGGSYIEVDGGSYKFGMMYTIKYFLTREREGDKSPYVLICTTRPETILGDSAICVNPSDPRFSNIDEIFRTGEVPDVSNSNYKTSDGENSEYSANTSDTLNKDSIASLKTSDGENSGNTSDALNKDSITSLKTSDGENSGNTSDALNKDSITSLKTSDGENSGNTSDALNKDSITSLKTSDGENSGNTSDALNKDSIATEGERINEELKNEKKNKYKVDKKVDLSVNYACEGLFAINPVTNEKIPVIFDSQADLAFGTGILKVTPCHDPVDFQLGKKHCLKFNKIFDDANKIINNEKYAGMKRFEARKAIVQELTEKNLFAGSFPHDQILPFCSRSGDIVEPAVKDQWWMDCKDMARKAMEGVESGEIKMFPAEAKSVWNRWLENIRDWCLSRQLWWGHRIPAYKAEGSEEWIVAESESEALSIAKAKGYESIVQDTDVLDTWFSSGLWPFSTLGWPKKTEDFSKYFPNSMLETGSDILFFWVARMVMLSYELCGSRPFDTILLHGIVRDSHGRKMSKSLGNVIDPLYVIEGIGIDEMINNLNTGNLDKREVTRAADAIRKDYPQGIPKCGADALRFALLSYTNGMRDVNLDVLRVQGYSRLCNKLYNANKFISRDMDLHERHLCSVLDKEKDSIPSAAESLSNLSLENKESSDCLEFDNTQVIEGLYHKIQSSKNLKDHQRWILIKLNNVIEDQHRHLGSYNFMAATQSIHGFFYDFCDYFIEIAKSGYPLDQEVLLYVFSSILRIFHPFMPFVTEELHHSLFKGLIDSYPSPMVIDPSTNFDSIISLVRICRSKPCVTVERFEGVEYLESLVKTVNIVDALEKYESVDGLKYFINE